MMLGVLLARQGVRTLVLEKHSDFLRDFRGDTVHPSTLEVVAELGWIDELLTVKHARVDEITMDFGDGRPLVLANFRKLPVTHPYIAFMPQWDFLNFLADKASAYPGFQLMYDAEVTSIVQSGDRITGVQVQTPDGELEVRAGLVVGADGRSSLVREQAGLVPSISKAPMDVLWFRLSRREDEKLPFFRSAPGRVLLCINRNDFWQVAYVFPSGHADEVRAHGLQAFRQSIADALAPLSDRVGEITSWEQVKLLNVKVDRLRHWHRPGLLCIGDAAHAMSPTGGVGINLAIQDAVAAANILVPTLRQGPPDDEILRRVQRRRLWPALVVQAFQVRVLRGLFPAHAGRPGQTPLGLRPFRRIGALPHLAGRFVGLGVRPEHVESEPHPTVRP
jgi:2-polyprenyl-6-methoxyphenol hydroxylase-like FAD-dependent oxidoreductase